MARQSASLAAKQAAQLTHEQIRLGIGRLQKRIEEITQFNPATVTDRFNIPELTALEAAIDETLVRTFGSQTWDYERYKPAAYLDRGPLIIGHPTPVYELQKAIAQSKTRSLALLQQAVKSLEERLAEPPVNAAAEGIGRDTGALSRKVFVVHGHDDGPREAVARFLDKIDFTPIILHEQANQGRTLIEKFEAHADVGFAVVLLTPDDIGGSREGPQQSRARQNVVLELGYFIGKLGRGHVCAIKSGELEVPSDIIGVVWTPFDTHGAWKAALAKELEAAGHEIDWKKAARP